MGVEGNQGARAADLVRVRVRVRVGAGAGVRVGVGVRVWVGVRGRGRGRVRVRVSEGARAADRLAEHTEHRAEGLVVGSRARATIMQLESEQRARRVGQRAG